MTLYELTENWLNVQQMMEDTDDIEAVLDTLEAIEGGIEDKAENYGKLITNLKADIESIKAEEDRLAKRRRTISNNIEGLKDRLYRTMNAIQKDRIKTDLFSFTIANNPPTAQVSNEAEFISWARDNDKRFIREKVELNKKALADALKSGEEINGATLIQTKGLRIR